MKEKQNFLAVKAFVYFGFNYSEPKEFIKYICEKTNNQYLYEHLLSKFMHIYDKKGAWAVMPCFFCELNTELQKALVEYAVKEYFPNGFTLSEEEKELLGI